MLKHIKLFFISFVLLQLLGCPAAIIGGGAIGIDTVADRRTPGVILEVSGGRGGIGPSRSSGGTRRSILYSKGTSAICNSDRGSIGE